MLKVLSSRYKCGETVRGDAVNEPPPVAPPVFPYDVAFAPSLDRSFELESSILAASSQFLQYFIDHIIEMLKRIIMSEPVSALDMQHLNVLTYCAHMHRINQYGESFSSVPNGSDNISLPKQTVNVEHLRIPTGLCSGLLPAAIVDGNELKLSSDPMDVRVAKKMGLSNDTTTPACDSVCTNRDSLPLGHVSKKCRVTMECGKKTINVATSVKGVEIVETPDNDATNNPCYAIVTIPLISPWYCLVMNCLKIHFLIPSTISLMLVVMSGSLIQNMRCPLFLQTIMC